MKKNLVFKSIYILIYVVLIYASNLKIDSNEDEVTYIECLKMKKHFKNINCDQILLSNENENIKKDLDNKILIFLLDKLKNFNNYIDRQKESITYITNEIANLKSFILNNFDKNKIIDNIKYEKKKNLLKDNNQNISIQLDKQYKNENKTDNGNNKAIDSKLNNKSFLLDNMESSLKNEYIVKNGKEYYEYNKKSNENKSNLSNTKVNSIYNTHNIKENILDDEINSNIENNIVKIKNKTSKNLKLHSKDDNSVDYNNNNNKIDNQLTEINNNKIFEYNRSFLSKDENEVLDKKIKKKTETENNDKKIIINKLTNLLKDKNSLNNINIENILNSILTNSNNKILDMPIDNYNTNKNNLDISKQLKSLENKIKINKITNFNNATNNINDAKNYMYIDDSLNKNEIKDKNLNENILYDEIECDLSKLKNFNL